MIPPAGDYRYETHRDGELVSVEEETLALEKITGVLSAAMGAARYEVEAILDPSGFIRRLDLRYRSGPFSRRADYEVTGDFLRGSVSALAGHDAVTLKLGRLREIDAGLMLFKALTIAHAVHRGQLRWTGRVAAIDATTLAATSAKQTYRRDEATHSRWLFEPEMGEAEEIDLDAEGRILRHVTGRGIETLLVRPATR